MNDSLYIIIPAYNEADNIARIIDEWYPVIENHNGDGKSRLVIIDDGSKDDTLEIAKKEVTKREYLEVITKDNGGHGSSIYFGYQYAIQEKADYVFQTDSDGQTLASEFEEFWKARVYRDVIIGNRISREDGLSRRIISGVVRTLVRIVFDVSVDDVNTPYRLMSTDVLEEAIKYVPKEFNLTNVALTAICARMAEDALIGFRKIDMEFKPITFRPRQAGKNSINLIKIVRIGLKAMSDLREINRSMR